MRYFHDVNSIIKKRLKALIWYTVLKKILTFDTLNRGRIVFFNGGNDDNLYQNICFNIWLIAPRFRTIFKPNCLPLSFKIFRMICYVKDGEIWMMNWYLVLLFSFLGSEIKSTSRKRNIRVAQSSVWIVCCPL
jgi:hypothetical protein